MANNFKQGWFVPKNADKYEGNIEKIRYMSSYELEMNNFLDNNPNVIRWSSEEVVIPYLKPTDNRVHRYFPDYWVEYMNAEGQLIQEIIEVKPMTQTKRTRSKNPKTRAYDDLQYAVNLAKWDAAQKFCSERGIVFKIITERSIFK